MGYCWVVKQFGELVKQFGELVKQFGELVKQFGELVKQFGELVKQFGELVLKMGIKGATILKFCKFKVSRIFIFPPVSMCCLSLNWLC